MDLLEALKDIFEISETKIDEQEAMVSVVDWIVVYAAKRSPNPTLDKLRDREMTWSIRHWEYRSRRQEDQKSTVRQNFFNISI